MQTVLAFWDQNRVFGNPANWDRAGLELAQPRILEDGFLYTPKGQTTNELSAGTTRQVTE